jgi:CheY-like chemotaxis protein
VIWLPAAAASAHEFAEADTETVLIVEDEPDLLDVASSLFLSMGYDVMTASSGSDALNVLASRDVDILFTDVVMPNGMNGLELANYTRTNYPNVKVMLVSGYPQLALGLDRSALDDFAFVSKPYRLSDLARSLRSVH